MLISVLTKALQELKAEKDAEIASLKDTHSEEIAALEQRLAAVEEHAGYGPRRAGLPLILVITLGGCAIVLTGAASASLLRRRGQ
jgi:hypothetical protein